MDTNLTGAGNVLRSIPSVTVRELANSASHKPDFPQFQTALTNGKTGRRCTSDCGCSQEKAQACHGQEVAESGKTVPG